tara:strand:+ start:1231 stop:1392 length:162 start_codon:yes stop_codon:yes gene_type:complete
MTKNSKNDNQEKINKTKEEFLKDIQAEEKDILDETSGGMKRIVDDNNWCDEGC